MMKLFGSGRRRPGWLCVNLRPDRIDVAHVLTAGRARPEVLICDSYRKEGGDSAALARLRRELHLARYRCTTLLQPADYQVMQVDAPDVPDAELKIALRWRIKDMIDYPVEAATVDAVRIPAGNGAAARSPQVLAVAAKRGTIAATVEPFSSADIPLEAIDIPEMALRNVAHLFEEPARGLATLVFDDEGGLLTFTCDGELYQYRRIDVSLRIFASAGDGQRQQIYDRIVLELQRSLDNFDRQFHYVAVARVLLVPVPGADDLQQYLASNLDLPVALLDLADVMDFPAVPELREPGRQLQCLPMLGAAMRQEAAA
ncbi:MAG: agglutinin biogenesis protein MshI [Burkholderiales bacterium]|nr:agglutinin biogenesis protein MshI [Burkholderiales bacterium]